MHFNLCCYTVLTCHVCRCMLCAGMEIYEETKHIFHWNILSASFLLPLPQFRLFLANCFSLPIGFCKLFSKFSVTVF